MNIKNILFCFTCQGLVSLCNARIIVDEIMEDAMETCIVDILSSKSNFGAAIAVINNDVITNNLIRNIHGTHNVQLCVKDYNVPVSGSPDIIVLHVSNYRRFADLLDNLNKDWFRKPEALFIVILLNIDENDFILIFRIMWQYHIIKVLVISDDIDDAASVYSYFPYNEGKCGWDYNNTVKLCDCSRMKNVDVIELLHKMDIPTLKNCTLQVATHSYSPLVLSNPDSISQLAIGVERFLLEMLFEKEGIFFNYSFYPEADEFGNISDNFTISGKLKKLYDNEADLIFGGFALNNRRATFFDYVCSHLAFEDYFVIVTPSSGLLERWKIIYKMFNPEVWFMLMLILFLCAVILSSFSDKVLFSTKSSETKKNTISDELFNLFGSITQNLGLHLRRSVSKNFVVVMWLWYLFLVHCYYQTRLTSFSTYQSYKAQLNIYSDLQMYNFTPCLATDMAPFFKDSGNITLIHEEYLEIEPCKTGDLSLNEVEETKTKYTVTNYFRYLWWITKNPKKKRDIHLMKESLQHVIYALFFKRGFPLLHKFNYRMLQFVECGFLEGSKGFHGIPDEIRSASDTSGSLEIRIMNVKDLALPFLILVIGSSFSFLSLILEILYYDKHVNQNENINKP